MIKAFERATGDWPRQQIHVEYFTPKEQLAKRGASWSSSPAQAGNKQTAPLGPEPS